MRDVIIADLDGCFSDDRWRRHHLPRNGGSWDAYHRRSLGDPPANLEHLLGAVAKCRESLPDGVHPDVCFVTGRPTEFRDRTLRWISEHIAVEKFSLYMRPAENKLTSKALKIKILEANNIAPERVFAAFDDRREVIAAYEAWGVAWGALVHLSVDGLDAPPTAGGNRAAEILAEAAETVRERNAIYRDNWRAVPRMVEALFPDGVPPELVTSPIWHLFELKLVKLTRFAASQFTHQDSIRDDAVYSALIESIVEEQT